VDVGVQQPRHERAAVTVDHPGVAWQGTRARGPDAGNAVVFHDDAEVRPRVAPRAVEQGRVLEDQCHPVMIRSPLGPG